jgi:hypothetical protein
MIKTRFSKKLLRLAVLCVCCIASAVHAQSPNAPVRPRIIVTADPELDDNNSMIRFLMYASDVNIEGLIYTSSQYHWKGDGKGTKWYVPGREYARFGIDTCPCTSWRWAKEERFIDDIVDAYAKAYTNLKVHNPNYPTPEYLKSKVRYGNIEFDGDISKNTPGSDLIKSVIMDDKPGKLFITAWGGASSIARALKSIQEQYEFTTQWEMIKKKISNKVVLLPSGDQDDMYAKYIKPNWPDIEYRQFRGGPNYGYGAQLRATPIDSVLLTPTWMKTNVTSRGPLGALYRVWGDGKQMVKGDIMDYFGFSGYTNEQLRSMGYVVWMPVQPKDSWLGEGDDHTFMNMPANGLRAYEDAFYGGWGGRGIGKQEFNPFAVSSTDTSQQSMVNAISNMAEQVNKNQQILPDFFPAAQADFANRLKWAVTPKYADANHAPIVEIEGPLNVLASAGETIHLNAKVSDPDHNKVTIKWWQFHVGTYTGNVELSTPDQQVVKVTVPKDAIAGQTIHMIIEVTDNAVPANTAYQRVIITIKK